MLTLAPQTESGGRERKKSLDLITPLQITMDRKSMINTGALFHQVASNKPNPEWEKISRRKWGKFLEGSLFHKSMKLETNADTYSQTLAANIIFHE